MDTDKGDMMTTEQNVIDALDTAYQLAEVLTDWSLNEYEINGEMLSAYDLMDKFEAAKKAALAQNHTPPPAQDGLEATPYFAAVVDALDWRELWRTGNDNSRWYRQAADWFRSRFVQAQPPKGE